MRLRVTLALTLGILGAALFPGQASALSCNAWTEPPFATTINGQRVIESYGGYYCDTTVSQITVNTCIEGAYPVGYPIYCEQGFKGSGSDVRRYARMTCVPGYYRTWAHGYFLGGLQPRDAHSSWVLITAC